MPTKDIEKRRAKWRRKYYSLKRRRPEKLKEKYIRSAKKIKQRNNTIHYRFIQYKNSAKKRNLKFDIDESFFIDNINGKCFYCGDNICGIGIDRIDNSIGYTKENICLCCKMCNRSKNKYTIDEFINMCKKVAKRFK